MRSLFLIEEISELFLHLNHILELINFMLILKSSSTFRLNLHSVCLSSCSVALLLRLISLLREFLTVVSLLELWGFGGYSKKVRVSSPPEVRGVSV